MQELDPSIIFFSKSYGFPNSSSSCPFFVIMAEVVAVPSDGALFSMEMDYPFIMVRAR